jgi:O-antigen ligase
MLLFAGTLVWLGLLILSRTKFNRAEKYLLIPYLAGIVPGMLYYVETRFKICSELLLVPLHLVALHSLKDLALKVRSREIFLREG